MNPIQAAVHKPYTVAVGVILLVIFSGLAIQRIPVQLKPTVDLPQITVQTTYLGASALEVEEQITRPLEEELQSVQGLVKLTSESGSGRSALTLELELGADTRLALIDVVSKLSRVPNLPAEADEPRVDIASSDEAQPVMWVAIPSSYAANRVLRLVTEEVKPHLERVPGVSSLLVVGGSEREVQIQVDPSLLVVYGVTPAELVTAITRGPVNVRGGTVESETRRLVVRTVGKPEAIAGLAEIVIKQTPSGRVRLGDVATVLDDYREIESFVSISGTQGVAIGVRRQVGANVVALIKRVDEEMKRLNTSFESRGLDIRLQPVYRETTYIDAAMSFVTSSLLLGAALSVVILIVFLRSGRSVVVVAASIPISMISVFLVLSALGRSLNVISLAGIAFASGMAVDNAIVVLENIFRHLEMGKGRLRAAIDGGTEVWGGVLASTLTTVAVFVPIVFQADEASQLFKDMALAISAAVAFSLVVALTVVPVLSSLLFKGGSEEAIPSASVEGEGKTSLGVIGRFYNRFLASLTRRSPRALPFKLGFVLVVAAASLACLRLAPPAEYLPTGNRNLVMFFAAPIAGTRAETIQASFKPLEDFLLAQPETERTFCVIATRFNGGGVLLKEEFATPEKLAEFHKRMFGPTSQMSGFRYVVPIRASLFRDPGKQFEVELSGGDLDRLEAAAGELSQRLQAVPGIQFVRSSLVTGNPEIQVVLDEERAKEVGLDVTEVGQFVEFVVAGRRLTTAVEDGREVDVNVLAAQEAVSSAKDLEELRFVTKSGQLVALGSVARVVQTTGPESVRHLERERNVLLTVNLAAEAPLEEVIEQVERDVLPELSRELGPNYSLRVGGSADKLRATLSALSGGFGLSIVIIYLLLVALFRSWVTPVVILVTVPLALSGGLIGIRLAHMYSGGQAAFDVIAMLGFVILAGLVVNNAILIVHQTNNFTDAGYDFPRALAESARSRLRPIVMSVVTTVVGMLPLALGSGAGAELYQGLGAIIVGGLLVSTLFTLFLVPVLLSLGNDLRVRFAGAPGQVAVAAPGEITPADGGAGDESPPTEPPAAGASG